MCRNAPRTLRSCFRPDMKSSAVAPLMTMPSAATQIDRSSFDARWIVKSLDGLPDDGADSDKQQQGIEKRRQDGSPLPSVGSARTRSFSSPVQLARPGHHEAEHVGEVVAGIRQEGERVREKAEGDSPGR